MTNEYLELNEDIQQTFSEIKVLIKQLEKKYEGNQLIVNTPTLSGSCLSVNGMRYVFNLKKEDVNR